MRTVEYTQPLFTDVLESMTDYHQLGETVCGAEDPAVIGISSDFGGKHPELAGYSVVRVFGRFVSPWKSDTFLEFSNREMDAEEYAIHDEYMEG